MTPTLEALRGGGVRRRLEAEHEHLPKHGIEFVDAPPADLTVTHALSTASDIDIYVNHGIMPMNDGSPPQNWAMNKVIVRNLRTARRVVAVSKWSAGHWAGDLGITPAIVPNGVDLADWEGVKRGKFRKRHGLKRPMLLWAKIAQYEVCDPEPVLRLAELMPECDVVMTFAPDPLPPNVVVVGPQSFPDMKLALADCDVYLATVKENFSVQVLEAMALGKPVAGFAWGGTPEAVQTGREGVLVEPENVEALAAAVRRCLDSPQMGEDGRARVERDFTWEKLMAREAQVWREALEEKRAEEAGPKVAVVVTNYNYHEYLPDALESIKAQTTSDWECVVVDDGSDVDPEPYIKEHLEDRRVRLVRQENRGVAEARNRGVRETTAPYVACLDADDEAAPGALEVLARTLNADAGLGIAYGKVEIVYPNGRTGRFSGWPPPYDFGRLLRGNIVPCFCLFRRRAWQAAGGYAEPDMEGWSWEDYELWLKMAARGWFGRFVDAETLRYRQHGESRIDGSRGQVHTFRKIIRQRVPELYGPARPLGTYDFGKRTERREKAEPYEEAGYRWVTYTGNKAGSVTFRGAKSKRYRFSSGNRRQMVPLQDVEKVMKHPHFKVETPTRPTVSVVIPCYNQAEFLTDAVESALAQTYEPLEVIVVDDGSTDGLAGVMADYELNEKVLLVQHPHNKGLPAARNTGIQHARGELILPLDADDVLAPEAASELFTELEKKGRRGIAYSDFWLFGAVPGDRPEVYELEDYDFAKLLRKNQMPCTALFPKEAWREAGGYKEEFAALGGWEDYEFWINLGKRGWCGSRIPKPLWGYRQKATSMRKEALSNKRAIADRIAEIHNDVYTGRYPMGCCGRGSRTVTSRSTSNPTRSTSTNPTLGDAPLVKVSYTGTKTGKFRVKGKETRATYVFSSAQNVKYVDKRDWQAGGWPRNFTEVQEREPEPEPVRPKLEVVKPTKEPPPPDKTIRPPKELESTKEPEPFDFTAIKGIGKATMRALNGADVVTLEDLALADVDELAACINVPGDKAKKVRDWQMQAKLKLNDDN